MRAPESIRPTLLFACSLAAFLTAACSSTPGEVGHPPEGNILRNDSGSHKRAGGSKSGDAPDGTSADDPAGDPSRIGVASTHRFHKPGCPELAKVPPADRTTYKSCWEAINADLAPCSQCSPVPQSQ
jgi:hypothetical protein